jgi:hypothetical protein
LFFYGEPKNVEDEKDERESTVLARFRSLLKASGFVMYGMMVLSGEYGVIGNKTGQKF